MVTGIVYSDEYLNHVTGSHVESPQRLTATTKLMKEKGLWWDNPKYKLIEPRKATVDQIRSVHSDQLINRARETALEAKSSGSLENLDGDTVMCGDSYEVALLAAGGILEGVEQLVEQRAAIGRIAHRLDHDERGGLRAARAERAVRAGLGRVDGR